MDCLVFGEGVRRDVRGSGSFDGLGWVAERPCSGPERPVAGIPGVEMSYNSLKWPERVVLRAEAHLCSLSAGVWGRIRDERAGEGLKWGVLRVGLGPQSSGVGRVGCEG